jgi:hypothetical protein
MKTQTTMISCATLIAAALSLPMMLADAQASTTSKLANCKANSKQKVIACCEKTVEDHKRPYWMSKGQNACTAAVVCSKSNKLTLTHVTAPTLVCYVSIPPAGGNGSGSINVPKQPGFTTFNVLVQQPTGPQ